MVWYYDKYRHSLSAKGIRTTAKQIECPKRIPVYKGLNINSNKPLDLTKLSTIGYWTLDSRVATLFSADPKNSFLTNERIIRFIENNFWKMDEQGIDPITDKSWVEKFMNDMAKGSSNRLEENTYGLILKSEVTQKDEIDNIDTRFLLEQEAMVKNQIQISEIGILEPSFSNKIIWINYKDIPYEYLTNSNKLLNFIFKNGNTKKIIEEIPKAYYLSLIHGNFEVLGNTEKLVKESYRDILVEGHDFWDMQCNIIPKYEGD